MPTWSAARQFAPHGQTTASEQNAPAAQLRSVQHPDAPSVGSSLQTPLMQELPAMAQSLSVAQQPALVDTQKPGASEYEQSAAHPQTWAPEQSWSPLQPPSRQQPSKRAQRRRLRTIRAVSRLRAPRVI
jgi:hypothetical protein